MTDRNIAWPGESDKYKKTSYAASDVVPPPFWHDKYPDGYTDDNLPDLSQDEHFQVWMRTAGLPTFRKLYFRNDEEVLASGTYEVAIQMSKSKKPSKRRNSPSCPVLTDASSLPTRLPSGPVRRNQVARLLDGFVHRWQEPFPRNRVHRCRRRMLPARSSPHAETLHQAEEAW